MTPFDPAAATAAWLAAIPPEARALAAARGEAAHWRALAEVLFPFAAAWVLTRTRLLDRLAAAVGPRADVFGRWAGCAAAWAVMATALLAAFALADIAAGPVGVLPALRSGAPLVLLATVLGPGISWTMARTPRAWPWAVGAVLALAAFALVYVPFASASGPARLPQLQAGDLRGGLVRLIDQTGLSARDVYVSGEAAVDAEVTGLPGHARLVVSRGMAVQATPAEARAGVGHLIGHFMHRDQLSMALLLAAFALAGTLLGARLFAPLARVLRRGGLEPSDPAGLPLWAMIAIAWIAVSAVAFNAFDRAINVRADQYSLDHAREPDGLAASLIAAPQADRPDPSFLEEVLFYDHPPLKRRLLHAMSWKAAHVADGPGA